jgi:hypothetical protein
MDGEEKFEAYDFYLMCTSVTTSYDMILYLFIIGHGYWHEKCRANNAT